VRIGHNGEELYADPTRQACTDNRFAQLPLGLLNAAQGHPMLVELKNGETLNGHLVQCDTWMNLTLKEVVQTSPEGDKFVRLPEVYIKGNNVWSPTANARAL
jgi:small nuclear ribonucleoprotein (snRNP)-like protein